MTSVTPTPSQPDPLLLEELEHFRQRWKSTEHIVEQRMTMLLTAVGAAIAISAALLVNGTVAGGINTATLLSILWFAVFLVAEGMFFRLIRARRSICRDIEVINFIRHKVIEGASQGVKSILERVERRDSTPPRIFSIFSIPSSAALTAATSFLFGYWFAVANLGEAAKSAHPAPLTAVPAADYCLAVVLLIINLIIFWCAGRFRIDHEATELPDD